MRFFSIFLLTLTACRAQSDQSGVEAVLKQLERAEQTGDFNAWAGLWTREKREESGNFEKMRPYVKPRPGNRYRAMKTYIRGDEAVLLVQGPDPSNSYVTMTLRREGSEWRIQDQLFRNTAPNPNSVYALLRPGPGAFTRAGSPWDQVAPAMDSSHVARFGFQLKAVFDESYLYIRFESNDQLPAPGSTIGMPPPGGWPHLKIDTSDAGEFVLYDQVNIGDQATFDAHGKANSHRAYAAYTIRLEHNDLEVFSASAGLDPTPLLEVSGRDYDIRIPLATMGIMDSRATRMTIGDAQWPNSAVVSVAAQRYPR
jgi:hypothetical protein